MKKFQLSFMMFFQFFIWGGWFVTLGTFLGENLAASGESIGRTFATQSWGAIIAPFIIGLIADRYFNAERILGILHIAGGILMYLLYQTEDFAYFYPLVLLYMILYMPTLALVNSISFRQMKNPNKEFGFIRLWGTVGWIVAGITIGSIMGWDSPESIKGGLLRNTFLMTALASFILGLYSFFLPKTPPKVRTEKKVNLKEILGFEALKLLKNKNYLIFFIASILICIPLAFYYALANPFLSDLEITDPTSLMTIGQGSEVLFLALLPYFIKRLGLKMTLAMGMLAWILRYILFTFGGDTGEGFFFLIMGLLLHGICYDFFFVCGQIYTEKKAGEKNKSAAQGMITLATYGLGMLIGFEITGFIADYYTFDGTKSWEQIWIFPAIFSALVFVLFFILFKSEKHVDAPQT